MNGRCDEWGKETEYNVIIPIKNNIWVGSVDLAGEVAGPRPWPALLSATVSKRESYLHVQPKQQCMLYKRKSVQLSTISGSNQENAKHQPVSPQSNWCLQKKACKVRIHLNFRQQICLREKLLCALRAHGKICSRTPIIGNAPTISAQFSPITVTVQENDSFPRPGMNLMRIVNCKQSLTFVKCLVQVRNLKDIPNLYKKRLTS